VHHVAREVSRRIPSIELGELVSAGALGLMKALDSFDLTRGLAFSTYAVLRIRGAILDDLRSRDSTPRSVRMKRRKIETVAAALEAELGRAPAPKEIADRLEIDSARHEMRRTMRTPVFCWLHSKWLTPSTSGSFET
jgi:RNA polymerase sigma factor for flagellar operon FliA